MAKVLIVDDEQSLLILLQEVVEEVGHQVLLAQNGKIALEVIEREQPELVISDVMMPVLDGYQLLQHIKLQPGWESIKVVLISAAPINRRTSPAADAYLTKPYDLITIEQLLTDLTGD